MESENRSGKKAVYFTIGGKGTKSDPSAKRCGSPWNPGHCKPSRRYINRAKL